ncbi:four helix bundle protein [Rubrivirga sp.]|uniref:four helix bundle protein n=1 Tax=Rubrivirga sp. TaxID=1885344 RepID=UPI003B517B05
MRDFRTLQVWQKAHACTLAVYDATRDFPSSERFNLTDQLRRSAVSVPSNIAEGCGRHSDADQARFVQIAVGSATEMDYQLLLARDLGYLSPERYQALSSQAEEVRRMLIGFLKRLRHGENLYASPLKARRSRLTARAPNPRRRRE